MCVLLLSSKSELSRYTLQGLGHTVVFVGDGINDLVALSAADIGYAVGATEAMVAAAISTSRSSVAGISHATCFN